MFLLLVLITLVYLIGVHTRVRVERDNASDSYRGSGPFCQDCGREMPPYNAGVVITWICPHCGQSRRHSPGKGKKPAPFDPDF